MKHKTWFRLVLKAIGILLIGLCGPELIANISAYFNYRMAWANSGGMAPLQLSDWLGFAFQMSAPVFQLAIGLYLLLGGKWLLDKIIPSNRPYCPECGYDLSENAGGTCTECGVSLSGASGASGGSDPTAGDKTA